MGNWGLAIIVVLIVQLIEYGVVFVRHYKRYNWGRSKVFWVIVAAYISIGVATYFYIQTTGLELKTMKDIIVTGLLAVVVPMSIPIMHYKYIKRKNKIRAKKGN